MKEKLVPVPFFLEPGPLGWAAVGCAGGIAVQWCAPIQPLTLLACAGAGAVAARHAAGRRPAGVLLVLFLWASLGALRLALWQDAPEAHLQDILPERPAPVHVHGIVQDQPGEVLQRGSQPAQTCVLQLRHVERDGRWQRIAGRLTATIEQSTRLGYGDELLIEGLWMRPPPPGNPGQFDQCAALSRRRIGGLLRVRPEHGLIVLSRARGSPWMAAVLQVRERWLARLRAMLPKQDAELIASLLLGERVALDDRIRGAFVDTGTMHLLVISGSNVGLVFLILELLLRWLGVPWRVRLPLCALGLGGYCALTGMQTPVARATLMAWILLGAHRLNRVMFWGNALAAAALGILWINPAQLFDPGFQLSFGAVLSLLLFTPRWHGPLEDLLAWLHPVALRRYVALSFSATIAVWVGLWPLLAWYFQLVSPISMIANLLLAPLIAAITSVGLLGLLAGSIVPALFPWLGGCLHLLVRLILESVFWCQRIPGGHWGVGDPSWPMVAGYYGLLLFSLFRLRLGLRAGRAALCWGLGMTVWIWGAVVQRAVDSSWLEIDVLDVGHGDSIVLRTPGRRTLLVDAGTEEAGRTRVLPFLRHAGITTLDALILTHPDGDHIGGAPLLLESLRVRSLLTNGASDDTMAFRRVREAATHAHVSSQVVAAGSMLRETGLRIDVLHPPAGLVPGVDPGSNDNSLVLKLNYGLVSILLTGDIEEGGLPHLLTRQDLRSTILKVPHHGSRLGEWGERLFRAVDPELAIISVGRLHHLPAPEIVQGLARTGAQLYTTCGDGAIMIRTDGVHMQVRAFRQEHR